MLNDSSHEMPDDIIPGNSLKSTDILILFEDLNPQHPSQSVYSQHSGALSINISTTL